MLSITIKGIEGWDEEKEEFVDIEKDKTIQLEHSLLSISKWESKWKKPFLLKDEKTYEETVDYIRCMTVTKNVDPKLYSRITNEHISKVAAYIEDSMTATWFSKETKQKAYSREVITSEIVYYWMVAFNIPFECEKWHFSRLLTLIRVCNAKQSKPEKRNKREMLQSRAALNEARKKKLHTRG